MLTVHTSAGIKMSYCRPCLHCLPLNWSQWTCHAKNMWWVSYRPCDKL